MGCPAPSFSLDALQFYEDLSQNTTSIQRVRLTCRRFASRASRLLLPVVTVSISDPSSVDRLEQITGHMAFAPYVKAVHVYFDVYEEALAADMRLLAAHLIHVWRGSSFLKGAAWAQTLDDLEAFCSDGIEANCDEESMRLLRREYAEYQRRYEAQKRLGESVIDRIAKAMARMPTATRLILDDAPDVPSPAAAASLKEGGWLLTPTSWATAFKLSRSPPPINMLFALPAAVHQAGVELTGLRIHRLRLPYEFPLWVPPHADWEWFQEETLPPEANELREACGSLRVFEFTPGYEPGCWPAGSPTHLAWPDMATSSVKHHRSMEDVLSWILEASNRLTHIRVDLQMTYGRLTHDSATPTSPFPGPVSRSYTCRTES